MCTYTCSIRRKEKEKKNCENELVCVRVCSFRYRGLRSFILISRVKSLFIKKIKKTKKSVKKKQTNKNVQAGRESPIKDFVFSK